MSGGLAFAKPQKSAHGPVFQLSPSRGDWEAGPFFVASSHRVEAVVSFHDRFLTGAVFL